MAGPLLELLRTSRNVGFGAAAALLYGSGRFLVLAFLARVLPPAQVGRFILAWAVVAPLAYLLNMELRLVLAADARRAFSPGACLTVRLVSNGLLLLVLAGIGAAGLWSGDIVVLVLVGMVRAVESWGEVLLAVPQRHERMGYVAASQALKFVGVLAGVVLAWRWWGDLRAVLGVWVMFLFVVILVVDRTWAVRFEPVRLGLRGLPWAKLLRAGVPLGMFMAAVHFNERVGQYFLGMRVGPAAVAPLGLAMAVATGLVLIQAGVNQALLPRLAGYVDTQKGAFGRLLARMLAATVGFGGLACLAAWLLGAEILSLVFGADYGAYGRLLTVVIGATAVQLVAMVAGDALIARHVFIGRLLAVAAGLLLNVILCWWWVRGPDAAVNAAWAAALAAVVTALTAGAMLAVSARTRPD